MKESEKTLREQYPRLRDRLIAAQNIANRENSQTSRKRARETKIREKKK